MTVLIPALRISSDALWLFRLSCRYRLGRHDFPDDYDDGSRCHGSCSQIVARSFLRLGATRWETIAHVVLPAAKSGIFTGIILGLARALGEAWPLLWLSVR